MILTKEIIVCKLYKNGNIPNILFTVNCLHSCSWFKRIVSIRYPFYITILIIIISLCVCEWVFYVAIITFHVVRASIWFNLLCLFHRQYIYKAKFSRELENFHTSNFIYAKTTNPIYGLAIQQMYQISLNTKL